MRDFLSRLLLQRTAFEFKEAVSLRGLFFGDLSSHQDVTMVSHHGAIQENCGGRRIGE